MKKLVFAALFTFGIVATQAQIITKFNTDTDTQKTTNLKSDNDTEKTIHDNHEISEHNSTFKPEANDITASFMLKTGGLINNTFENRSGMLRGRYFVNPNIAYRAGFGLKFNNKANEISSKKISSNDYTITLAGGIEKHMEGTKNLSPYYGGELSFGMSGSSTKKGNTTVDLPGSMNFGLIGVFGADYYFVKNVYLGVEGNFGVKYTSESDSGKDSSNKNISVSPGVLGVLKLGFIF